MRARVLLSASWILMSFITACTQEPNSRPAWLEIAMSQDAIDPALGEQSVTAALPLAPPRVTYEDQPLDTDPVCWVQRYSKIARVTIDAIVRDYHNPGYNDQHLTVYRLRVHRTIKGKALPEVVYGETVTGCYACRYYEPDGQLDLAFPCSRRRVGETGVALLSQEGMDPIRPVALAGTDIEPKHLPARVLFFGMFIVEQPDGTLDAERDHPIFHDLVGSAFSYQDLDDLIARIGSVSPCNLGGPTRCDGCDTSQTCREGEPTPCACANDYAGCTQLPPEDPKRSRLYQP